MAIKIKNKLSVWDYNDVFRWYRFDKRISLFFRKIKWVYQRAKYGWCDRDLWNLDWTLGNYIASSVNELANRTHGYPHGLSPEEWDRILRRIARNFYLGVNEDCWTNPYENDISYEKNYYEWGETERTVWNKWLEEEGRIEESMRTRRREGFCDLVKWYSHLWD